MRNELILKHPILINGKYVKVLPYDADEITAVHFAEAESKKMRASGSKGGNLAGAYELDYSFHLYLGFAAIIAVNPEIDYSDLERIKGTDVREVMNIGRNFTIARSEETSVDENSDEQSGTTLEPFTHPSETLNEND